MGRPEERIRDLPPWQAAPIIFGFVGAGIWWRAAGYGSTGALVIVGAAVIVTLVLLLAFARGAR
jgi:hypothetical protein